MEINVRHHNLGEQYARRFQDQIGDVSRILFRSNKDIIIVLSEDMHYISHKIIDPVRTDNKKKLSKRTMTFTRETLDLHPRAQHVLKLVKENKYKCRAIKLIANVGDVFIKRVFAVYNIESLPHQIPTFRT